MRRYPLYILDLDGTLFRGDEPTPDAVDTVARLREGGAAIRFLTNNSSRTRAHYAEKLRRLGFDASEYEIYSSATATATFLEQQGVRRAFVVGEDGLVQTLAEHGISSVDDDAEAVVAGICRGFTYDWLNQALQHLLGGARFIATNTDATYPLEGGRLEPGAGAIVAAIQACSGRSPEVIGKPNPYVVQLILQDSGIQPTDALVVGDRVDTDLEAGRRAGCPTHLVLTGIETIAAEGQRWSEDLRGLL